MAYCGWLSGLLITAQELEGTEPARLVRDGGWSVGLPSELEWEKASRGGRVGALFPWGDAPDPSRANSVDSGIDVTSTNIVTSTVGCFPANGFGLLDMIGNVWEWTRSRLEPYPYLPGDGRENPRPKDGAIGWSCAAARCTNAGKARAVPSASRVLPTFGPTTWVFGWCCALHLFLSSVVRWLWSQSLWPSGLQRESEGAFPCGTASTDLNLRGRIVPHAPDLVRVRDRPPSPSAAVRPRAVVTTPR